MLKNSKTVDFIKNGFVIPRIIPDIHKVAQGHRNTYKEVIESILIVLNNKFIEDETPENPLVKSVYIIDSKQHDDNGNYLIIHSTNHHYDRDFAALFTKKIKVVKKIKGDKAEDNKEMSIDAPIKYSESGSFFSVRMGASRFLVLKFNDQSIQENKNKFKVFYHDYNVYSLIMLSYYLVSCSVVEYHEDTLNKCLWDRDLYASHEIIKSAYFDKIKFLSRQPPLRSMSDFEKYYNDHRSRVSQIDKFVAQYGIQARLNFSKMDDVQYNAVHEKNDNATFSTFNYDVNSQDNSMSIDNIYKLINVRRYAFVFYLTELQIFLDKLS